MRNKINSSFYGNQRKNIVHTSFFSSFGGSLYSIFGSDPSLFIYKATSKRDSEVKCLKAGRGKGAEESEESSSSKNTESRAVAKIDAKAKQSGSTGPGKSDSRVRGKQEGKVNKGQKNKNKYKKKNNNRSDESVMSLESVSVSTGTSIKTPWLGHYRTEFSDIETGRKYLAIVIDPIDFDACGDNASDLGITFASAMKPFLYSQNYLSARFINNNKSFEMSQVKKYFRFSGSMLSLKKHLLSLMSLSEDFKATVANKQNAHYYNISRYLFAKQLRLDTSPVIKAINILFNNIDSLYLPPSLTSIIEEIYRPIHSRYLGKEQVEIPTPSVSVYVREGKVMSISSIIQLGADRANYILVYPFTTMLGYLKDQQPEVEVADLLIQVLTQIYEVIEFVTLDLDSEFNAIGEALSISSPEWSVRKYDPKSPISKAKPSKSIDFSVLNRTCPTVEKPSFKFSDYSYYTPDRPYSGSSILPEMYYGNFSNRAPLGLKSFEVQVQDIGDNTLIPERFYDRRVMLVSSDTTIEVTSSDLALTSYTAKITGSRPNFPSNTDVSKSIRHYTTPGIVYRNNDSSGHCFMRSLERTLTASIKDVVNVGPTANDLCSAMGRWSGHRYKSIENSDADGNIINELIVDEIVISSPLVTTLLAKLDSPIEELCSWFSDVWESTKWRSNLNDMRSPRFSDRQFK